MGEQILRQSNEIKGRWMGKMPRFFRQLVVLCVCIVATAFGINTAMTTMGATPHEWWTDLYPLLIGVPTGMAIVCKLTVAGGYKEIDPDKVLRGGEVVDRDAPAPNMSDVETERPDIEPLSASDM